MSQNEESRCDDFQRTKTHKASFYNGAELNVKENATATQRIVYIMARVMLKGVRWTPQTRHELFDLLRHVLVLPLAQHLGLDDLVGLWGGAIGTGGRGTSAGELG